MSPCVKSAILSLTFLAGVASIAYAQSENVAALPPASSVATPGAPSFAPPTAVLGPDPGAAWNAPSSETRSVTRPVQSSRYLEPVRNPDHGGDSD